MRIAIVGGGAAGMMCAAAVLESCPDTETFLIERNDGLGKKVIISGGGRCNVTTGIRDVRELLQKYPRGGKFLTSSMYHFPPDAVYDWFESHGVPLKTQEDRRVFPQSDEGRDIVRVFIDLFKQSSVKVMLNTSCIRVEHARNERGFYLFLKGQSDPLEVDRLVLTTGGQAYRQTGSTGDGYAFAASLGHTVTPLAPSLSAFFTSETWPGELSGLSFQNATISSPRDKTFAFTGPFLFTHRGVSGPAVFALSSIVAFETYDAARPLELRIDLFPDAPVDTLRARIESYAGSFGHRQFVNVLGEVVPKSLAEVVRRELGISETKRANQVSKREMLGCAQWLKAIPLHAVRRGAGDEFVTAGGVELSEVDPATMRSKICPGLSFAGEILNVDGFTGGFNLQASWATGRLAGEHACDD
jgi:predicted Rossmann fold flavoprotein